MQMKSKILPPTYFIALLLLSATLNFVYPIERVVEPPYTYLGIIPILFGTVLNIWSDSMFKKSKTTVKPHETPTALMIFGPFRISRHPMYLGMAAILLGEAVFFGSLITFAFPAIFVILMAVMFIPAEEDNLERAFGGNYHDYKKKVRHWI